SVQLLVGNREAHRLVPSRHVFGARTEGRDCGRFPAAKVADDSDLADLVVPAHTVSLFAAVSLGTGSANSSQSETVRGGNGNSLFVAWRLGVALWPGHCRRESDRPAAGRRRKGGRTEKTAKAKPIWRGSEPDRQRAAQAARIGFR